MVTLLKKVVHDQATGTRAVYCDLLFLGNTHLILQIAHPNLID